MGGGEEQGRGPQTAGRLGSGTGDRDQHLSQWHRAAPTLLAGPSVTRAPGSSRVHRGTGRRVPGRGARHLSHAGVALACVSAGETDFMVRWAAPGPRPLTPMPFPLLLGKGGGRGRGVQRPAPVAVPETNVFPRALGHVVGAPRVSGSKSRGPVGRPVVPGPGASRPRTLPFRKPLRFQLWLLPAVAPLSPAWPDQPDQLPATERMTHAVPPGVTASAAAVPTVRPPSPVPGRASPPTPGAQPPSQCGVLCGPRPGHFWGASVSLAGGSQAGARRGRLALQDAPGF